MKGIKREIKVFSVIGDFKSKKLAKDKDEVSSIKMRKKYSLELRIDKLEKLVADIIEKKIVKLPCLVFVFVMFSCILLE